MTSRYIDKNEYPMLLALLVGACLIAVCSQIGKANKAPTPLVYAPEKIRLFSFGYNEVMADVLWLRVLQDFDKCDSAASRVSAGGKNYCENGWAFSLVRAITELAPKFRVPVRAGANLLSIVLDDKKGAAVIYALGIERFPWDWKLPYYGGYHALFELNDQLLAAQYFEIAANRGAPAWLHSSVAKIYSKEGRLDLARGVLEKALESGGGRYDDRLRDTYKTILKEIEESPDGKLRQ